MGTTMGLLQRVLPLALRRQIILSTLLSPTHLRVLQGPFRGTRYGRASTGSYYYCKLLGTYEKELTPCVEEIVQRAPEHIIDVGAAEGYYAVGFARRLPQVRVTAFEMNTSTHPLLRHMAERNGVAARLTIRGKCEPDDLRQAVGEGHGTVLICDVEGYETTLLDLQEVPALRYCPMLVELHDILQPGITPLLRERFGPTHTLTIVAATPRTADEYPLHNLWSRLLTPAQKCRLLDERPPGMTWLWAVPRS
jgi:hypothetical protein